MKMSLLNEHQIVFQIDTWIEENFDVQPSTEMCLDLMKRIFIGREPSKSLREPKGPLVGWIEQIPDEGVLWVAGLDSYQDHSRAVWAIGRARAEVRMTDYPQMIVESETGRLWVSWRALGRELGLDPTLVRAEMDRFEDCPSWAYLVRSAGGGKKPKRVPGLTLRMRPDRARALGVESHRRYYRLNPNFSADMLKPETDSV